ncbi:MAG: hypothetical protein CL927_09025 [Deltaproteobacteria bacterium]|nr:hypothetical protein [Deltaproteobacteria bacterium]HCH66895.1 hypothetical protein [Deltaproteobacteria bacterium]
MPCSQRLGASDSDHCTSNVPCALPSNTPKNNDLDAEDPMRFRPFLLGNHAEDRSPKSRL